MFDSLIFDVDGTIWNTTGIVAPAWNEALDECGCSDYHVTPETLQNLFGKPMNEIIETILPDKSDEIRKNFEKFCYPKEAKAISEIGGIVYPEMEETLRILSSKIKLYIVSNCQSGYIESMLKKTGFGKYFSDFTCYGDKGLLKAENIRLIIDRNNLQNAAYIGDTQGDADATHKAGIPFIHASYGFGKTDSADFVITKPKELLKFLK